MAKIFYCEAAVWLQDSRGDFIVGRRPHSDQLRYQVAHNICTFVGNGKILGDNIQNFSMNAYRRVDLVETGVMVGGELVGERPVEQVIGKLFEDPHVKYLHARTATVGCFVARVERANLQAKQNNLINPWASGFGSRRDFPQGSLALEY